MDKRAALTLADHTLVNAATEAAVSRVSDTYFRTVMDDVLATFRDVLPHVSRENRMIGDLANACDEYLEHYHPARTSAQMTAAQFHMAAALGTLFRWKHAGALAAFHAQQEGNKP